MIGPRPSSHPHAPPKDTSCPCAPPAPRPNENICLLRTTRSPLSPKSRPPACKRAFRRTMNARLAMHSSPFTKLLAPNKTLLSLFHPTPSTQREHAPYAATANVCALGENVNGVSSLVLPDSLLSLPKGLLKTFDSSLSDLSSLTLPFVGTSRTEGCALKSLFDSTSEANAQLPRSLSSVMVTDCSSVCDGAFLSAINLTAIRINDGCTSIGSRPTTPFQDRSPAHPTRLSSSPAISPSGLPSPQLATSPITCPCFAIADTRCATRHLAVYSILRLSYCSPRVRRTY